MMLSQLIAAVFGISLWSVIANPLQFQLDLSTQIETQYIVALNGVLDNLGPDGKYASGVAPGTFIASPSTEDPDYFYTWTRDSALTMKMIIDRFVNGEHDLRPIIQEYVKAQAILQTVTSLSGAFASGRGLGEPKFNVNLTRWDGSWGRPQRDGPALRATALISYARHLLDMSDTQDAQEYQGLWSVIRNDLEFTAQYWNTTGFDLWEETLGSSFFATGVQYRALVEGAVLGKRLHHGVAKYEHQAQNVLCFLQTYWSGSHAVANINTEKGFVRTGIDANTVLASVSLFDPEADCDDVLFQPCSSKALANLHSYIDSFEIYDINKKASRGSGIATGRYAEDVYYGGNPWYLTTLAVAEQLYDAVQQWSRVGHIFVNADSIAFWQSIYPLANLGTFQKGSIHFDGLLRAALVYADSFVSVALKYIPADGSLSEQFSRSTGTPLSARDLTWSYASFITMRAARTAALGSGPQVPSWGAPRSPQLPSVCAADAPDGHYIPAYIAGAPANVSTCSVLLTFNLNATTVPGESRFLLGNTTELGVWNHGRAIAGNSNSYSSARPLWSFWQVEMPGHSFIEYQYFRRLGDGREWFESGSRIMRLPDCEEGRSIWRGAQEDVWMGAVPYAEDQGS